MKVALLGVGAWGTNLLRNLVSLLGADQVVAVDPDPRRQAWAVREYPALVCHSRLDGALADPDVQAVVVATPARSHAEGARAVLEAGRHVFVEKPLATSTRQAVALARLAEDRELVMMVGHTFLFGPHVRWISQRLRRPGIGDVHYVTSSRLNLGPLRHDTNVIWDLAPHDFSVIMHLLGETPLAVSANARDVVRPGTPDVAFMNVTFPSGIVASVVVSWLAPRKVRNLVVVGRDNMILYDDMDPEAPVRVYDKGATAVPPSAGIDTGPFAYRYGDTVAPHIERSEPLAEELAHFLECVKSGARPVSDGWFGARVVAALEAADRSWRESGRPAPVADVG